MATQPQRPVVPAPRLHLTLWGLKPHNSQLDSARFSIQNENLSVCILMVKVGHACFTCKHDNSIFTACSKVEGGGRKEFSDSQEPYPDQAAVPGGGQQVAGEDHSTHHTVLWAPGLWPPEPPSARLGHGRSRPCAHAHTPSTSTTLLYTPFRRPYPPRSLFQTCPCGGYFSLFERMIQVFSAFP